MIKSKIWPSTVKVDPTLYPVYISSIEIPYLFHAFSTVKKSPFLRQSTEPCSGTIHHHKRIGSLRGGREKGKGEWK